MAEALSTTAEALVAGLADIPAVMPSDTLGALADAMGVSPRIAVTVAVAKMARDWGIEIPPAIEDGLATQGR